MLPIIHKQLRQDKIKEGKCPIILQVYFNKKRKQIFTGLSVEKEFWDKEKEQVTNKHRDADWLNRAIKNKLEETEREYFKQSLETGEIDLHTKTKQSRLNFFDYSIAYYDAMKNTASEKYIGKAKTAINDFKKFSGNQTFQSITPQILKSFEDHLFSLGRARNTINYVFKKIKQPYTQANREGITDHNPFNIFKAVSYKQTKRSFLTIEEIRKIEKIELPASLDHIRNYFLLACYIGLRFGDVQKFDKSKYIINNNGVERIIISTEKMEEPVSIKLSENVKIIISKLNKPLPSNVHTNRLLKIIGEKAKIKTPLNFHLSRHSAAVNMASAGLPIEAVAKVLGHTNIRTTAIYYKLTDTKIDDYLDQFNKFMDKK